jgi:Rod binding domain-containing protein
MTITPEQPVKTSIANKMFKGREVKSADEQHTALVEQTEKWVAATFYGTLLKQVRNNPFKSEMLSGGQGGEAFGSLYDQQMAEHMSRGTGKKLVNAIVRKIEAANAYSRQQKPADMKKNESTQQLTAPRTVEASPSNTNSTNARNVRSDVTAVR